MERPSARFRRVLSARALAGVCLVLQAGCRTAAPVSAPVSASPAASPAASSVAGADIPTPPSAEQIRATLTEAVAESPADPQGSLELALFDARTGRADGAMAELQSCAARFPTFARAQGQLGVMQLQSGDFPAALASLERAAALAPDDSDTLFFTALAAYRAGRPDAARRYAAAAIRQDPESPHPYLLLSYLNDRHGTATVALANLRDYLARSPQPAPGCFLMGRIYAKLNDRANAEMWLKRAVDADPRNPSFLVALGRLYTEQFGVERMADGIRCFQQALTTAPDNRDAHRYLGHALLQQQRYAEALSHLEAAAGSEVPRGPVAYDLAQALLKMGRTDEGKRMLAIYQREAELAKRYEKAAMAAKSPGLAAPAAKPAGGDIFSLMEGGNGGD